MKRIYFILLVMVGLSGCKKTLDINQNPNQPTSVTPNVVLSAALVGTAFDDAVDFINLPRWLGYWSRSGSFQPDEQTETYGITNSYTDVYWTNIYSNLNNYDYIEKTGLNLKTPFYVGVAKLMKAYQFSILVDAYNDVPYTQAFNVQSNIQPKYDKGEDIYNDLVSQLDSAIFYFEEAKNTFYPVATTKTLATDDQYDIVFGSARLAAIVGGPTDFTDRMTEWEKFANTWELRLLLHQSKVASQQTFIQAELKKISDNGFGFLGAGENAAVNPGYQASTGKQNPFYGAFYTATGSPISSAQNFLRANTYAVNFYNSTNDDRNFLFYSAVNNAIAGNYDGDPLALTNAYISAVGTGILKGNNQDQLLLGDFESLFLQAEAAQAGWISGNPESFYESAITQSYVYLYNGNAGIVGSDPAGDAMTYYTSGIKDADWTASPDKTEAIITQKWAAMNGIDAIEAWDDYRRTGVPNLPISSALTHVLPKIPVRFLYPEIEFNTNGANVPNLGANAQFTATVFWNQ